MSKSLVCMSEPLPFYAQDVCKEKSFNFSSADSEIKDKTEKKDILDTNSLTQDENMCNQPPNSVDQVLKRNLSRKREASNILVECVKRRDNMQNMEFSSYVPFESNNCTFINTSHDSTSVLPNITVEIEKDSEASAQNYEKENSLVLNSFSTDSGFESSKNSSPTHSLDNVSNSYDENTTSLMEIDVDECKDSSQDLSSDNCASLNNLCPKSTAISEDLNGLNLEETSQSKTSAKSPIIQSLFKSLSPMLYFSTKDEIVEKLPEDVLTVMKWKLSTITPVLIRETVLKCGFQLVDIETTEDWLGTWGKHLKCLTFRRIKSFQKVNHYPGSFHLGRKDKLWNNIKRMQKKYGKEVFGFFPDTYVLPADMKVLKKTWEEDPDRCWIKKPCASARGTGVKLIHKWSQVPKTRPAVVQRYVSDPYLINGSKFDLRLYVLVPSFNPLRIYLFEDGLVRFASEKYSLSDKSFANRFIHLTNYSINKKSSAYTSNDDVNLCQGHKWSLKSFWSYMSDSGIDVDKIKATIVDMIIKTVIGAEGPIRRLMKLHARRPYNCFELFGFDIMLDKELQPWLLEVNISPSLHSKSTLDLNVKGPLVRDMLNIAGFELPQKPAAGSTETVCLHAEGIRHQPIPRLLLAEEIRNESLFSSKYSNGSANVLDDLTLDDLYCLMETEDENNRRGSFLRVFPTETSDVYFKYFDVVTYYNRLLWAWEQTFHDKRINGISKIQELFEKVKKQENHNTKMQEPEDLVTITVH
ncbi:tubulin monoglutamylase TTLL4 [Parasteatoda tepidariorum]|uniref:tubulin monoglutamylase TTLL4 n=1 Tax=Parasteatoda tepidariorum TaxID=114398 RepID=UPI00077FD084|nr:tubulin polyglutamylase TTLL4 [Parasteatoda tepidariorum]XP_042899983.1 tubulin polyglutamylase TTLL4 [Parasteatoda tepidariorum]XP_042899984.1 tubulin polyglutamylase TTLL4 [Parasteatoda tepidariorum]